MQAVKLQTPETTKHTVDPGNCFELNKDSDETKGVRLAFIKMLKRASKQMGQSSFNLNLCAIRIKSDGRNLHMYATDGHSLCHVTSDYAPEAHAIAETLGKFDYAIADGWSSALGVDSKSKRTIANLVKSDKILISNSMVIFEGKHGEMIDFQHLEIGRSSHGDYFVDVSTVYPVKQTNEWSARFFTSKHKGDKTNIKTGKLNAIDCILKCLIDLRASDLKRDKGMARLNLNLSSSAGGESAHATFQLVEHSPAFTGCAIGASNVDLESLRNKYFSFHYVAKNESPFFIAAIDNESYANNSAPRVAISAKYLLNAIEGESVTIRFGTANCPIVVEVYGCTTVIMPVRL